MQDCMLLSCRSWSPLSYCHAVTLFSATLGFPLVSKYALKRGPLDSPFIMEEQSSPLFPRDFVITA